MKTVIYYRQSLMDGEELAAAGSRFETINSILDVREDDLVIGRYSVLPFYEEQERDIITSGAKLINSYAQHRYIADIANWYENLKDLTPKTYFNLTDIPDDAGPFIVKGETNSKKFYWRSKMFAHDKAMAIQKAVELSTDSLLQYQNIYVRDYIPLKTYYISEMEDHLPITEEYRIFVMYGKFITGGFYWQNHIEDLKERGLIKEIPSINNVPWEFIETVINRIKDKTNAVVIDVARTKEDKWIVIELNDLQMSGLSCVDPMRLYSNMALTLEELND